MARHFVLACIFGLVAAGAPARAAEVWCPNPLVEVLESGDHAGKDDPKCAVRLFGARNGAFSGQVVVAAEGKGPEAAMSDLKQAEGDALIPASAIEVRYALPTGRQGAFDALAEAPRAEGKVHPVWVTVNVPADAKPGEYAGTLSVAGREVPVLLAVHDWTLPSPREWTIWADFIQSPRVETRRFLGERPTSPPRTRAVETESATQ